MNLFTMVIFVSQVFIPRITGSVFTKLLDTDSTGILVHNTGDYTLLLKEYLLQAAKESCALATAGILARANILLSSCLKTAANKDESPTKPTELGKLPNGCEHNIERILGTVYYR